MKLIKPAVFAVITILMLSILTAVSQPVDNSEIGENDLTKPEPAVQAEPLVYEEPQLTRSSRVLENDFIVSDAQLTFVGASAGDVLGLSVAFGDIDNDGIDDLIMGAPWADGPKTSYRANGGEVLVKFGYADQPFPGTIDDMAVGGYDMIIYGSEGQENWQNAGDTLGTDIATGDFNGDGYDDIIMGAPTAELINNPRQDAGAVFVTYGGPRSSLPPVIDLASGADFTIWGYYQESQTGFSVAAGDVDNDGYDDIIVGSPYADPSGQTNPGMAYVVYGSANPGTTEDVFWSNRSPDTIVIVGDKQRTSNGDPGDQAGYAVASGDVNGDQFDDMIIGSHTGQLNNGRMNAGAVHVILGSATRGTVYDLGTDARVNIWGDDAWDYAGHNLESTDIDGDGLDDLIISVIYGDALNNAKSNAGEVCIIYGSTSLAQDIQLNTGFDAIVYGRNVNDYLGEGLAVGNLNNDQYMDFAVGARYNDGDVFNLNNGGATYAFLGEDRTSAGTLYDTNTETVAELYGRNASDQHGFGLAMGDFDGDGMDDIAAASLAADGPVSARDSCGEVYIIYGQGPPMKINGVEVLDSTGQPTDIVYSKYDSYTFRVNVTNVLGALDLSEVVLTLDPSGEDIQYKFTYSPGVFAQQKDTNGFTTLASTPADARKTGLYNWELDFKLEFDWSYPNSGKLPCEVTAKGSKSLESTVTFDDVFEVEDDLEFTDVLEVYDDEGALLTEGDWAAGGETIAFTNLIPVYQGTTGLYPPTGEFEVTVIDSSSSWTNATNSGEPIHIDAALKTLTDPNDQFAVSISSPATESPRGTVLINLSIDGEMPEPPSDIEFRIDEYGNTPITAVNSTEFYVNWDDGTDAFSGIRGYYYSLVNNGGTREGSYTTENGAVITDAPEGLVKIYLWSTDNAGNIGLASSNSIFVDLDNLMFFDFKPDTAEWQVKRSFNCSIEIDDSDGVGIDSGSIFYKISTRGVTGYGSWLTASDIQLLEDNKLKAVVDIRDDFAEGTENFIKFKASDLAGNTQETGDYNIKLDVSTLEYQNEEPAYHTKQTSGIVSYTITIADSVSDVDTTTVEYRLSLNGINGYDDWTSENMYPIMVAGEEIYGMRFRVDLDLQPGKDNYIRWRAKDTAGNGYTESTDYMIWVNSAPKPVIASPDSDGEFKTDKAITFSALGTSDNDNDTLTYKWRSSIDGEFGFIKEVSWNKLSEGTHEITLEVSDGISTEDVKITVEVKTDESALGGTGVFGASNSVDLAFMIILIIVIVLIVLMLMRNRKQLQEKDDEVKRVSAEIIPGSGIASPSSMMGGIQAAGQGLQSAYGGAVDPSYPQLPGTGQPMQSTVIDYSAPGAGVPGAYPDAPIQASSGVAPALPQLPPAFAQEYPHLDHQQKLDLLEEKFLTGQISENLYMQLKDKYQRDFGTQAVPPQGPAPVQTPQPPTQNVYEPQVQPGYGAGTVTPPGTTDDLQFKRPDVTPAHPGTFQPEPPVQSGPAWPEGEDVLDRIQIPGKENNVGADTAQSGKKIKKIKKR